MKKLIFLAAILSFFPVAAVLAGDSERTSIYDELDKRDDRTGGAYCDSASDCRKQDRTRNESRSSTNQIGNSFDNGRNGNKRSISDIINNQLEPSGGR